ncbi:hypothetical protein E5198_00870 [Pseudomonas sp. A-1]|uniref:hypothetical protein n=1 Tax=Pseudomonas sp. A-1 TaxID=1821274 RepID=UPI0010A689DC|nr:hypothetical protein [Pseudomonas sp. A-1]THG87098.1 hypothetical protein E5198_00870 [Pseudomonas sp. A-1]
MRDNDDNLDTELDTDLLDRGDEVGDLPPEEDELPLDDEEREENEGDAAAEEEPAPAKGSRTVPHARFNEVNEQLKQERAARLQLEEELARARGAQQTQPSAAEQKPQEKPTEFDFKAARKQLREAIYEGDDAKAEQLEEEIERQTELRQTRIAEQRAQELLEQRTREQQQKAIKNEVETAVAAAYASYPFLDAAGEQANQDAIDEVIALRDLYISRGKSPAQAIADAVAKVGPRYAEAPAAKPDGKATIEQNLERERRIPPTMPGVGERARKIDYANLSEDEFERLPEAEKRKARGDFVG